MAALDGFTRASDQDFFRIEAHRLVTAPSIAITGQDARQFYEHLVEDEKGDAAKMEKRSRRKGQLRRGAVVPSVNGERGEGERGDEERRGELQGLRLLRFAHEGDTCALKDLLTKGADINFQDSYLWTSLMCASYAGHREAVRLLLQRGAAWVGVVDLQGRDARDLAMKGNAPSVQSGSFAPCPRWCESCRTSYTGPTSSHLSSTLHLFNLHRPPPTPSYCLPASSTSYQMMLRCGWAPGSGLGPEGSGAHQPVPTVLKRDTEGLGYGHGKKARVTHFKAMDVQAVLGEKGRRRKEEERRVGRGVRREEERKREQKDKNWERDFRSSFYL
uniref:G-patch domain-containing protein n=1 Tax=Periophthalmus magnuspinnatus TaxID=409849 RepID=A0A3B4B6G4_9GOBI